jgi:uncharacterized protein (TIGR03435 family)
MRILFASLFVVCSAAGVVLAQASPAEFDAATIKLMPPLPVGTPLSRIILAAYRNGTLRMESVTLSEALRFAYDLTSEDQVSGPDWIKSRGTRYEVAAKTAGDVPLAQARVLMQKLLADRLKVVIRKEPKPLSFAALVQARGGSKLVEADSSRPGPPQASYAPGRIVGSSTPMPQLALLLSTFERQMILDRTGLTGRYQISLEYLTEAPGAVGDQSKPTLQSALQDQLGLRLEARREPLDSIVVERAEPMPTEN